MSLPDKKISARDWVSTNLCVPTKIVKSIEVITGEGERETVSVSFRILQHREIFQIKSAALRRATDDFAKINKDISSMTTQKSFDDLLADYMNIECLYRSCYDPDTDTQLFPNLLSVEDMGNGNVGAFIDMFWFVHSLWSTSRSRLTEAEMIEWEEYIKKGLMEDSEFFFLSLSKASQWDFMKHLVSRLA